MENQQSPGSCTGNDGQGQGPGSGPGEKTCGTCGVLDSLVKDVVDDLRNYYKKNYGGKKSLSMEAEWLCTCRQFTIKIGCNQEEEEEAGPRVPVPRYTLNSNAETKVSVFGEDIVDVTLIRDPNVKSRAKNPNTTRILFADGKTMIIKVNNMGPNDVELKFFDPRTQEKTRGRSKSKSRSTSRSRYSNITKDTEILKCPPPKKSTPKRRKCSGSGSTSGRNSKKSSRKPKSPTSATPCRVYNLRSASTGLNPHLLSQLKGHLNSTTPLKPPNVDHTFSKNGSRTQFKGKRGRPRKQSAARVSKPQSSPKPSTSTAAAPDDDEEEEDAENYETASENENDSNDD